MDVGCLDDIAGSYEDVRFLVDHICSLGFDAYATADSSDYVKEMKDIRVTECLNRYYQEAKRILIANRDFLDAIVNGLMDKKTLSYKDIRIIRDKYMIRSLEGYGCCKKTVENESRELAKSANRQKV